MLLHTQQAKVNYTSDINIDGWLLYQHVILFYCFFASYEWKCYSWSNKSTRVTATGVLQEKKESVIDFGFGKWNQN